MLTLLQHDGVLKVEIVSGESSDITMHSRDFQSSGSEAEMNYDDYDKEEKKIYHKGKFAGNLVASGAVSSKAAKILKILYEDGVDVPTPNQSTVYRSTMKKALIMKNEMIANLHKEPWSLHFEGKNQAYRVSSSRFKKNEKKK